MKKIYNIFYAIFWVVVAICIFCGIDFGNYVPGFGCLVAAFSFAEKAI